MVVSWVTHVGALIDMIRDKMGITSREEFLNFDSINEYVAYCSANHIEPIIVAPIIIYMDGIATAKICHTVLSIKITLGNLPIDILFRNEAWEEITLIDESHALTTTILALNRLMDDMKTLQSGIILRVRGVSVKLTGYPLCIIADGKQKALNLGIHTNYFPCPWCYASGMELLIPTGNQLVLRDASTVETISLSSGAILRPSTNVMPLFFHSIYSPKRVILNPYKLHVGDILHDFFLGVCTV
ncbi:hypothetical protein ADUPG1_012297 [Aduncisulcus paluster]|uniref:Uncharacterized protein n=1 Tax=Aduncisulcus paluster TaxID=2918883 RepID=A0ABQ5JYZ7_9EUKA|nr:hypothetical protein ADUPG1_012297 [Aduncisulcus paluster]